MNFTREASRTMSYGSKTLTLGEKSRQLCRKNVALPEAVTALLQEKNQLEQNIQLIERRLLCGSSSEPLSQHLKSLIERDMRLNCQLTDLLVALS